MGYGLMAPVRYASKAQVPVVLASVLLLMCRVGGLDRLGLMPLSSAWGAVPNAEAALPSQQMTDGLQAFERGDFEAAATSWR